MESIAGRFKTHWQALAGRLGLSHAASQMLLNSLQTQYFEPHRHYHTARHIVAMLDGFEQHRDQFADPDTAALAIFFHDAIYDPARRDNETRSAEMLQAQLSGLLPQAQLDKAAAIIAATAHHAATGDRDTDLVLDLDMAILGQPWAVYERYAEGIAREFIPVHGEALYRQGRPGRFLEPTLQKERIFLTPEFAHLDAPAKRNLQREIDGLRQPPSPGRAA